MGWDDYEPALADAEIGALMHKVDVYADAECEALFPKCFSAVVEIRMADGTLLREFVRQPRGEPETMMGPDELREKFSLLVQPSLGAAGEAALFDAIGRLGQGTQCSDLFEAATPRPR